MTKLSESTILVGTSFITGIGALLALIGLATPYWLVRRYGLWNCNNICSPTAATLTILAFIFLAVSFILLVFLLLRVFPKKLSWIPLVLLIFAALFLVSATSRYLQRFQIIGYSFELIVTAQTFAFLASILLAFWFGITMSEVPIARTTTTTIPSSTVMFSS